MTFETERLILEVPNEQNLRDMLIYLEDNRDFLKPWDPVHPEYYFSLEYQRRLLYQELEYQKEGRLLKLWIRSKEHGVYLGYISFSNIIGGSFQSCFLGYKLHKDFQNQGYMTEALEFSLNWMFYYYGLHRVEANIMPRNIPSLRVVQKLGFHEEGLAKKYLKINGVWEDHIHMVKLNEEME